MRAFVINLARSPDRRAHITAELEKLSVPYEIVEGIEGRDLDLSDTSTVDPSVIGNPAFALGAGVPGAAGCALSHLRVYGRILEEGLERAVVLEDDVVLPPDFIPLVDSIGRQMTGAEVVLLNVHSAEPCRVTKEGSVPVEGSRLLVYPVDITQPKSAGAYLITREACARLQRAILPVRVPADEWNYFVEQGALDRARCVVPMPVANSPAFRSTIEYYHPDGLQGRVRKAIAGRRIPLVWHFLAYRRRRAFARLGQVGQVDFVESDQ